ncbi:hypothetical protein LJR129_003559 [Acidovorax sp. LjRoot129]|uniref:hypothetical protein n=1 Tax=Acidovorax sp. LjRoot129 TaxID=3342260 RepID=UPI003ECE8B44
MQNILKDAPGRYNPSSYPRPSDLSPKWAAGVVTKVRSVRVAALAGGVIYDDPEMDYVLQDAAGVIELTGGREGAVRTCLVIGFSNSPALPPPSFALDEGRAIGTLSLPAQLLPSFLHIAQLPNAHFRLGGDGSVNGLTSEPTMFQQVRQME